MHQALLESSTPTPAPPAACDAQASAAAVVPEPGEEVLAQSGYGLAARVVMATSRGLALVLVSRALGPAAFGAYSIVIASYSVFNGLATLGLDQAHVYSMSTEKRDAATVLRNVTWLSLVLGCTAAAALWGAVSLLRESIFDGVPTLAIAVTAAAFPAILAHNFTNGMLLGRGRFRTHGTVEAGKWILHLALVVGLAVTGHITILSAAVALYAPIAAAGVVYTFMLMRSEGIAPRRLLGRPSWSEGRHALHFGVRSGLANVAHVLHMRLDVYLLKYFADAAMVGRYALAVSMTDVLLYAGRSVGAVAFASRASTRRRPGSDTVAATRTLVLLVGVAGLVIFLFAAPAVRILFGAQYDESVTAVYFRLPGLLLESAALVLTGDLLARAALRPLFLSNLLAVVVGFVANLLVIPAGGMAGAAAVFSGASLVRSAALAAAHARSSARTGADYVRFSWADLRRVLVLGKKRRRAKVGCGS